ncbi:MAG: hypothetical protein CMJ49_05750 [Planctomycetaceae bacterium]|nr:hypothetical protein [Planctomycetaceae bacterium]
MGDKLRFGLVGCGDFGSHIAGVFCGVSDVVAVCDVNEAGAATAANELPGTQTTYTDYRRMIETETLDGVIVAAANFVHAEITIAAAEAGLHVFCEKAMARRVPECWDMVRACEQNHVKLMIGHKRRLRPPWARMIELTDESLLGRALSISVTQYADMRPYDYPGTWWADGNLSGGAFAMLGVHVIDWFRAMCGDVKRVWGMHGPRQEMYWSFPEIINATYEFESGALAAIHSSTAYPVHRFREAQGPMGQCAYGGFKLRPHMDHIDLYWQHLDDEKVRHERFDDLGFDHAYRLEVGDFIGWITEDRQPCLTWVEGLRCVEMMEAAYKSAVQGGAPIDLPLYPELE